MRLITARWPSIVRSFAPDPVRPSSFLQTLTIAVGVFAIIASGRYFYGVLTGQSLVGTPRNDIPMRVLEVIAIVVDVACWVGVIANIRAARWAMLGLIGVPLVLGLSDMLVTRQYLVLLVLPFSIVPMAVVALPLFRPKQLSEAPSQGTIHEGQRSVNASPTRAPVRGILARDPLPPSRASSVLSNVVGLANILGLASLAWGGLFVALAMPDSGLPVLWALVQMAGCGVLIALWAGVILNIRAARWVVSVVYAVGLASELLLVITPPYHSLQLDFPWYALSLAAAAHPLFLRRMPGQ